MWKAVVIALGAGRHCQLRPAGRRRVAERPDVRSHLRLRGRRLRRQCDGPARRRVALGKDGEDLRFPRQVRGQGNERQRARRAAALRAALDVQILSAAARQDRGRHGAPSLLATSAIIKKGGRITVWDLAETWASDIDPEQVRLPSWPPGPGDLLPAQGRHPALGSRPLRHLAGPDRHLQDDPEHRHGQRLQPGRRAARTPTTSAASRTCAACPATTPSRSPRPSRPPTPRRSSRRHRRTRIIAPALSQLTDVPAARKSRWAWSGRTRSRTGKSCARSTTSATAVSASPTPSRCSRRRPRLLLRRQGPAERGDPLRRQPRPRHRLQGLHRRRSRRARCGASRRSRPSGSRSSKRGQRPLHRL